MKNKISRISSKLYFDLFDRGGHKLIAAYCILKSSRNGEVKYYAYKSKNNKKVSGYSLLRAKTNMSLHSIERYVPILTEMGLCFIDTNGDFILLGNQKVKDLYTSYKLVPIVIGKNITDTATNSMSVLIHAAEKQQQIQYSKKLTRSEILKQGANPKNLKEYKRAKTILKRFGEVTNLNEKTVLSIEGFAVLRHGDNNKMKYLKSSGCYWKRKLKSRGLVSTERQFEKIEKMSYSYFCELKKLGELKKNSLYKKGFLVEEKISSILPIDLIASSIIEEIVELPLEVETIKTVIINESYKKKLYLQFDMIDFWINGEEK